MLLGALLYSSVASGEGSAQAGSNQTLVPDTVIQVDALRGEVIQVSGQPTSGVAEVRVTSPAGATRSAMLTAGAGLLPGTALPASVTTGQRFAVDASGRYALQFSARMRLWDVTVTPDAATAVRPLEPPGGRGRVSSRRWHFDANRGDLASATNADFFVVVPLGVGDENYVWRLDFEGLAGIDYFVVANGLGLDPPASRTSRRQGSTIVAPTPRYDIFLSLPASARGARTEPRGSFVSAGLGFCADAYVGAGAELTYESNIAGTVQVLLDVNRDGRFTTAAPDAVVSGDASPGRNTVRWDGDNAAGAPVPAGTYEARLFVRSGEFHFVAQDVETARPGLRIQGVALPGGGAVDVQNYWDDTRVVSGDPATDPAPVSTLPTGISSATNRHAWGNFTTDEAHAGDGDYMDTWVFGAEAQASFTVTVREGLDDPDGDTLRTARECSLGLRPDRADTDGDTLPDNVEATASGASPDTDRDGRIDGLDTDSDGDGITDLAEAGPDGARPADTDGDRTADFRDLDSDGDLDPDREEGSVDTDRDGTGDWRDRDSDNDCAPDDATTEDGPARVTVASDPNAHCRAPLPVCDTASGRCVADTDRDGDGVPNLTERALGTDPADPDSDHDGLSDGLELLPGFMALDTDMDGRIDALDPDDDNDGIPTLTERRLDPSPTDDLDGDGTPTHRDTDSDGDGDPDREEAGADPTMPANTDRSMDDGPDFLDTDSDNDCLPDRDPREDGAARTTPVMDLDTGCMTPTPVCDTTRGVCVPCVSLPAGDRGCGMDPRGRRCLSVMPRRCGCEAEGDCAGGRVCVVSLGECREPPPEPLPEPSPEPAPEPALEPMPEPMPEPPGEAMPEPVPDAAADAAREPGADASALDVGQEPVPLERGDGCGCRVPAGRPSGVAWVLLALGALLRRPHPPTPSPCQERG
ncbi:MAG: hypothetical protein HY909_16810, partial [Deltaproteobacteria bacterium]|nr:hypothetical protein [Deltaproteobacteria bacterium]